MKILVHAAVAVSLVSLPVSADAARRVHKTERHPVSGPVQAKPGFSAGNAAAGGNNANSMSGSNSAAENAIGRTNCC
jgi:hypothetical protein